VLVELDHRRPLIVDRALYRELAKGAIARTVEELRVKVADLAASRNEERRRSADESDDPVSRERIHHLAVAGVRLAVEELREDMTKTRKDGSRGRLKIDYGDPKEPEAAIEWLWRFLDRARTAGELYGRALVVIAAEQYASRLVLPASQRTYREHWGSHRDLAAKALRKLAGRHVPASLKQLERAVEQAHASQRGRRRGVPFGDASKGQEEMTGLAARSVSTRS
jgi:hypothetical protein